MATTTQFMAHDVCSTSTQLPTATADIVGNTLLVTQVKTIMEVQEVSGVYEWVAVHTFS
jgi:hypothetical protein